MPQTSYVNQAAAFAGMIEGWDFSRSFCNDLGTALEVIDVAIDTVTNSATYTFTINGYVVSAVADASATAAEVRDVLIAAGRAVPELEALCSFNPSPTGGATAPVRITAKSPSIDLTYADSDAKISATTITAYAAGVEIPFGRAVVRNDTIAGDRSARLPTAPTAQVVTITPTAVNSTAYQLSIALSDGRVFGPFNYTSDGTATAAEIVAGFLALINASGCPVTASGTTTLILTSDNPGARFAVVTDDANLAQAATTASANGDFLGVAKREHAVVNPAAAGEGVGVGQTFPVIRRGSVWIEAEEALGVNDQLHFRHTANGANTALGRFRNDADSNTCLPIPMNQARVVRPCTGPGLCLIELNLP